MSLNPNAMEFSPARPQMSEGDEPKRKRKKGKERAPPTPSQLLMREVGQACKTNDALRGLSAYRTARDASTPILPQTFNSLLALVSGLSHHIQGGPEGAEAGAAASAPASGGSAEAAGKESGGVADAIAAAAAATSAAASAVGAGAATGGGCGCAGATGGGFASSQQQLLWASLHGTLHDPLSLSISVAAPSPSSAPSSLSAVASAKGVEVLETQNSISLTDRLNDLASAPGYPKQTKEVVRQLLASVNAKKVSKE